VPARRDEAVPGELERLRLENETLSGVVGVVASGPDLAHILARVVDLLTGATSSHACFVYLRSGEDLVLRAASPVYSHLIGRISFGADQGLAGWVMERGQAEFIRDGAIDDPRTVYVPELKEEHFQSMVAIPISSRSGISIGAIVLHTVAPREFDEGIINVLSRAASLVSGAIENAHLYEEARERVEELTRLSSLAREIAAVSDRRSLFSVAARGIRELIGADVCRLYETDLEIGPQRVAADPPDEIERSDEGQLVRTLLAQDRLPNGAAATLGLPTPPASVLVLPLDSKSEPIGAILIAALKPWPSSSPGLLRTAARQVGLALEKVSLIERLTEENVARDLFDALAEDDTELASRKAAFAGIELARPHLVAVALSRTEADPDWHRRLEAVEKAIRRLHPGAVCDLGSGSLRALLPTAAEGIEPARRSAEALAPAAAEQGLALGFGESRAGAAGIHRGIGEARDAARIGSGLLGGGGAMLYRDTGAYRYLIDLLDSGGPSDHLREVAEAIAAYDAERHSELLLTLDTYLAQGRNIAAASRELWIHVNTLRQRLERIEALTGIVFAEEDMLALQLAVKLVSVKSGRKPE
jgi:GAF domain-containing protein